MAFETCSYNNPPSRINAVAYLRQMQKTCKQGRNPSAVGKTGEKLPLDAVCYIEVDEKDIAIGSKLAIEILGRSLDELSIPARNLLKLINEMLDERLQKAVKEGASLRKRDITFTRRGLRDFSDWTNTRLHKHLRELIDLEYVFYGKDIKTKDVERAIELSTENYCGVSAMLKKAMKINHTYRIEKVD